MVLSFEIVALAARMARTAPALLLNRLIRPL
jgi:hypothetical protein